MLPETELQIIQHNQPPINPWTICLYELMTELELPLRIYVVQCSFSLINQWPRYALSLIRAFVIKRALPCKY